MCAGCSSGAHSAGHPNIGVRRQRAARSSLTDLHQTGPGSIALLFGSRQSGAARSWRDGSRNLWTLSRYHRTPITADTQTKTQAAIRVATVSPAVALRPVIASFWRVQTRSQSACPARSLSTANARGYTFAQGYGEGECAEAVLIFHSHIDLGTLLGRVAMHRIPQRWFTPRRALPGTSTTKRKRRDRVWWASAVPGGSCLRCRW